MQQFVNYYASSGLGDICVVAAARGRAAAAPGGPRRRWRIEARRGTSPFRSLLVALLALVPTLSLDIPIVFDGPLDSPGTLGLLALCLVFAGLALRYDLLFGLTGLLSFGHALYFAIGVYVTAIALTKWELALWQAFALTARRGDGVPLVLGAIGLRVSGIAFAMVTLAFAQVGQVLVQKNPDRLTGGEEGLGLNSEACPTSSSAS